MRTYSSTSPDPEGTFTVRRSMPWLSPPKTDHSRPNALVYPFCPSLRFFAARTAWTRANTGKNRNPGPLTAQNRPGSVKHGIAVRSGKQLTHHEILRQDAAATAGETTACGSGLPCAGESCTHVRQRGGANRGHACARCRLRRTSANCVCCCAPADQHSTVLLSRRLLSAQRRPGAPLPAIGVRVGIPGSAVGCRNAPCPRVPAGHGTR